MAKKKVSFRSLFRHADAVDKLLMTIGFFGAVCHGWAFPASLFLRAKILNKIGSTSQGFSSEGINNEILILCYLGFAQGIACFLGGYCWSRSAERQGAALRVAYLKAVLRQEVSYFDLQLTSTAEVIASVSGDSLVIQDFISEKLPTFIAYISTFFGGYLVAFLMLWRLAIVGFPFMPFLVIPGLVYGRVLMGIAREIGKQNGKADTIVEKAISSIRTVYSFVGEAKTSADYSAALEKTLKLGLKQGMAKGLAVGSNGIVYAIWSFLCYYGSRLVMYHGAKGGTVYAVGVALNFGGLSLGSSLPMLRYFSEASEAAERTMDVMERVPHIDSLNMEGETLPNVKGEVEFRLVEFAYPSRPETLIFKDLNLKIPAQTIVALIGESGSGKSSALALLQRFYDPLRGEILLDGVRVQNLQLKWFRSQIGIVSQEPALFATTIKENIVFGKEDASLEEVIQAAKSANAHDFISQLPQGYDTQVGERGVQMSGGQKQRIAIARAIIKAPKILLLDEATSALDAESERVVQQALDKVAVGVTTIIIAHQLSTIRNADLIAVVKNGRIVESGSHHQLITEEDSLYASLIHLQQTDEPKYTSVSSSLGHANVVSSYGRSDIDAESHKGHIVKDPTSDPSFTRLFAMSLPEWKQGLVSCAGAVLFGAVAPLYSFTMGAVLWAYFLPDHEDVEKKTEIYCLCFAGLALFSLLTNICQHYNFAAIAECLTKRIREGMLSKLLTFEIGWFDREDNATAAICSRLAKDANLVRSLVGDRMSLLIQTVSSVLITWIMALVISWRLSLVLIAAQPLMVCFYYFRLVSLKKMSAKAIKSQNESSKIAAEAVSNIRIVTSFSSQNRILEMLGKAQQGARRESIRQSWLAGTGLAMSYLLLRLSWAFAFWYGNKLTSTGAVKAEAFFQVLLIVFNTSRGIADAGIMTSDIAKGSSSLGSVFTLMDRKSSIQPDDPAGRKPGTILGHIELCGVDFAYPSRPEAVIFREFSLEMEPAKSTAIVGRSGSGKSTIIGLIERFYDPVRGSVKIDGRDIRTYHLRELRRHISLVSQEPALFSGTIRENITYGSANSDHDHECEMVAAAKAANAHEFITGLKDGYDTQCGDRGVQLSGGQKQRIAIARAVLKNPRILLLDEATSALDSHSEKLVQEALDKAMIGRTSVVVAHRLSTIHKCDVIAVLDGGQVVEKGSHSSLVAKGPNGAYFSLLTLQTKPIS